MRNLSIRMQATNKVIFLGLAILLSTSLANSQEPSGGKERNASQWREVTPPEGGTITALLCRGKLVLAATSNGIFVSHDSGAHWKMADSLPTVKTFAFTGTRLLAATSDGIFSSEDNGQSWQPAGEFPGDVLAVQGNKIFAGADNASHWSFSRGVFVSTNQGKTWQSLNFLPGAFMPIENGMTNTRIKALLATSASVLAGTPTGIFRSQDGGRSWTKTGPNFAGFGKGITALVSSGARLFAGTDEGVFVSADDGRSWTLANQGLPRLDEKFLQTYIVALAASDSHVFAVTRGGLYRSDNQGQSWEATAPVSPDFNVSVLAANREHIFAGTEDGGVFLSTDQGRSWTPVNRGLSGQLIRSLAAQGARLYAQTEGSVFAMNEGTQTWQQVRIGQEQIVRSLARGDSQLFAATRAGKLFVSTDEGQQWKPIKPGLEGQDIYEVAAAGQYLIYPQENQRFISADGGQSWSLMGLGDEVTGFAAHEGRWWVGTKYTGVWVSTDRGQNWMPVNQGLPRAHGWASVKALAVSDGQLLAGTSDGVFVLNRDRQSWRLVNQGQRLDEGVEALAVSGANVLAGLMYRGVILSPNGGLSWQQVGFTTAEFPRVTAFAIGSQNVFAATTEGVFRSENHGQSWQRTTLKANASNADVRFVASNGTNVWAVTPEGLFLSADQGQSWQKIKTDPVRGYDISALAFIGKRLLMSWRGGLLFSDDNGDHWQQSKLKNGLTALAVLGDDILAGTWNGTIFLSTDQGENWRLLNIGLPDRWPPLTLTASQTSLWAMTADKAGGLYVSTNQGHSWKPVEGQKDHTPFAILGDKLFARNEQQVLVSTDQGRTWLPSKGLSQAPEAFVSSGAQIFAGMVDGVYRSTDEGRSWVKSTSLRDVRHLAVTRTLLYACAQGGQLFAYTLPAQ